MFSKRYKDVHHKPSEFMTSHYSRALTGPRHTNGVKGGGASLTTAIVLLLRQPASAAANFFTTVFLGSP